MQQIKLTDLINIDDPREYKLHLACLSQDGNHPLDEYVENKPTLVPLMGRRAFGRDCRATSIPEMVVMMNY